MVAVITNIKTTNCVHGGAAFFALLRTVYKRIDKLEWNFHLIRSEIFRLVLHSLIKFLNSKEFSALSS